MKRKEKNVSLFLHNAIYSNISLNNSHYQDMNQDIIQNFIYLTFIELDYLLKAFNTKKYEMLEESVKRDFGEFSKMTVTNK